MKNIALILSLLSLTANAAQISHKFIDPYAVADIVGLQAALDAKTEITTTLNGYPLSSNITLTKADIGLGNADNTSDVNKPISTLQQAALDLKEALANKDTDVSLAANSDVKYPSQKAIKSYVDTGLALKENTANKSIDGTLAGNSDVLFPSQKAVKTYADTKLASIPRANYIYVEKNGNDSTCVLGDAGRPCLTKAGAEAVITLAAARSDSNQYVMKFGHGDFTATSFDLYPWMHYIGEANFGSAGELAGSATIQGTQILCSSNPCQIRFHSSVNVVGTVSIEVSGLYFQGYTANGTSLDSTVASMANNPTVFLVFKDSYISGQATGLVILQDYNVSSSVIFDHAYSPQTVSVTGGGTTIKNGSIAGNWTFKTATGYDTIFDYQWGYGGLTFVQTGVQSIFGAMSDMSYTGGSWVDSTTAANTANIYVANSSATFNWGDDYATQISNGNIWAAICSAGGPHTYKEVADCLRDAAYSQKFPIVYGTRASPVSISSTGFVTNGTNVNTSAKEFTVYAAGSTANAITTITAATPISICASTYSGSIMHIVGASTTNPILLPWKTGKLEIAGDFILSNGSSIDLVCDATVWRELARHQGAGVGANGGVVEANSTDGFYSDQNLVPNGSAEAGSRFAGATVSAGTYALTTTAANVARGAQAFSIDFTATGQNWSSTLTAIPLYMRSKPGILEMDYINGDATITLQLFDGTSVLASQVLATAASFTHIAIPFTFPASGSVQARLVSSANSAIMQFDNVSIKLNPGAVASNMVYVSKGGSDSSCGANDPAHPCLTIAGAQSKVVSATNAAPWVIKVMPGTYAETIALQDNVYVDCTASIKAANVSTTANTPACLATSVSLNAAMSAGGRSGIDGFQLTSAVTFDLQTLGTTAITNITISNVLMGSTLTWKGNVSTSSHKLWLNNVTVNSGATFSGGQVDADKLTYFNSTVTVNNTGSFSTIVNISGTVNGQLRPQETSGFSTIVNLLAGAVYNGGTAFSGTGSAQLTARGEAYYYEDAQTWTDLGLQTPEYQVDAIGFLVDALRSIMTNVAQFTGTVETFADVFFDQGFYLTTTGVQPTCDVNTHSRTWLVHGGTGVPDDLQMCMKKTDDSYVWVSIKVAP